MPYVHRDETGKINGLTRWPDGSAERLPDDDAAVLAYLGEDLAGRRTEALTRVDAEAELARARWITPGAGQALCYEAKRREAEAWAAEIAAAAKPDPAGYSWMRGRAARLAAVAEAAVTQAQMQAIADEWNAKAAAWVAAGIAIEAVREQAKEDIAAAVDMAAIDAVLARLDWPAPV